jgi:hypothetical protein
MSTADLAEYALWLKLANDPSQSEDARRQYRARLEAYVHTKLREAFKLAAGGCVVHPPPPATAPVESKSSSPVGPVPVDAGPHYPSGALREQSAE